VNLQNHRSIILIFRLILGVIFLTSAFGKLVNIERYSVDAIYEFGILPMILARPFGLVMPFLELLCGLGLVFGVLTRLSALGISLMSLSFFIAKTIVLFQGRNIDCGCFGAIVDTLASVTIYMDLPLMFMALTVLWANQNARHWKAVGSRLSQDGKEKLDIIW
jgi:putative oxidoreductase